MVGWVCILAAGKSAAVKMGVQSAPPKRRPQNGVTPQNCLGLLCSALLTGQMLPQVALPVVGISWTCSQPWEHLGFPDWWWSEHRFLWKVKMCHLSAETLLPRGKSGDHKDKGLRNFSNTAFQVCFYLVRIQNHGVNLCKNLQKESSIYPESKLYQPTSPSPSCISIPQGVLSENTQPLDVQVFHCGSTLKIKSRVQDMILGNSGSVLKFEWVVYCLNPMQW